MSECEEKLVGKSRDVCLKSPCTTRESWRTCSVFFLFTNVLRVSRHTCTHIHLGTHTHTHTHTLMALSKMVEANGDPIIQRNIHSCCQGYSAHLTKGIKRWKGIYFLFMLYFYTASSFVTKGYIHIYIYIYIYVYILQRQCIPSACL